MATPRDTRRLALLALYQLDARGGPPDTAALLAASEEIEQLEDDVDGSRFVPAGVTFTERERRRAVETAMLAWEGRAAADRAFAEIAPEWPPHRQASLDRAILRLAHHEITSGGTPPRAAINEAVELAKVFSTEKSPAFINGVLGKLLATVTLPPAADDEALDKQPAVDGPAGDA